MILIRPPRGESTLGRLAIRITSDGVHFQLHSCHTRLVPRIEDVTLRTFAELLTAYMDRTGIGDAELARRIPVSRPTLVRWKEGVTARPRYRDDVLRCAELLRLSSEERDEFLLAAGFSPETAVPADQAEAVSEQVEFTADSALAPVGEDGDSEDAAPPTVHPKTLIRALRSPPPRPNSHWRRHRRARYRRRSRARCLWASSPRRWRRIPRRYAR